jgi:hypothetical protein
VPSENCKLITSLICLFLKVTSKTFWGGNKSYLWGWGEIWARGAKVAIKGLKREFAFWVKASSPVTSTTGYTLLCLKRT